jgi:hypothetical protein
MAEGTEDLGSRERLNGVVFNGRILSRHQGSVLHDQLVVIETSKGRGKSGLVSRNLNQWSKLEKPSLGHGRLRGIWNVCGCPCWLDSVA